MKQLMSIQLRKALSRYLFFLFFLLVISSTLSFECLNSSHGGPYQTDTGRIDTTNIRTLEEPVNILLYVFVEEYDNTKDKHFIPLEGAAVYYYNADTTVYSDTNGYTSAYFPTSTMPFKFSYEITKDGFKSFSGHNWDTLTTIGRRVTIERNN